MASDVLHAMWIKRTKSKSILFNIVTRLWQSNDMGIEYADHYYKARMECVLLENVWFMHVFAAGWVGKWNRSNFMGQSA